MKDFRISRADLMRCIELCLEASTQIEDGYLVLDESEYWEVAVSTMFNIVDGEPELVMGDLVDDVEEIRRFLENPGDAFAGGLAFVTGLLSFLCFKEAGWGNQDSRKVPP